MQQLKIDRPELLMAFDSGGEMTSYYPDIEAGEIIGVSGQECG
jgi:hypothetical protein